jgi:hypothetical protein
MGLMGMVSMVTSTAKQRLAPHPQN